MCGCVSQLYKLYFTIVILLFLKQKSWRLFSFFVGGVVGGIKLVA